MEPRNWMPAADMDVGPLVKLVFGFWSIFVFNYALSNSECLAQGQPGFLAPGDASAPGRIISGSPGQFVTFNWSQTSGTLSYQLNIRDVTDGPNGPVSNFTNNAAGATFRSVALTYHHSYRWNVYACSGANATGSRTLSATNWFRLLNPPTPDEPGQSSETSASTVLGLTPRFLWTRVRQADAYGLYVSKAPYGPENLVYSAKLTDVTSGEFSIPSNQLAPGTRYRWDMTSYWNNEETSPSSELYFVTDTLPVAPLFFAVIISEFDRVILGWSDRSDNEFGFTIARRTGSGNWSRIADVSANVQDYTDSAVMPGTTYTYRLSAFNGIGQSSENDATTTTPPSPDIPLPPTGLSASAVANGISLIWNDNSVNETAFVIQRRRISDGVVTSIFVGANEERYLDTSVVPYTDYCYTVRAESSAGHSSPTQEQCATFAPPNEVPVAIIAGSLTPVTGSATYSANYSTGSGTLQYSWVTSDGQRQNGRTAQFQFNSPGQYIISLIVTDLALRTSTASVTVNVQAANNGTGTGQSLGADPVVLSSGNYIQEHIDLRLPGKGFPFEFKRFYNSKFSDQTGCPIGFGWTHSYNQRIQDTGTNVLVIQGDGATWTFFPTNGGYVAEAGVFDSLVREDDTWLLRDKAQTVRRFTTNGLLLSITDKNANTLTLFYEGGFLRRIQDTVGRTILFHANDLGCISEIVDPIGRTIRFEYEQTNLVRVIDAKGLTNSYTHTASNQLEDARNANGVIYLHNEYDPLNSVVVRQHDAFTNWTYFAYDFTNRITYQTNALGKVSIHSFDHRLLVTNIVDEAGHQQGFGYDDARNRILIRDKDGNATRYGYDSRGNVTSKTDALGNITTIEYDSLNSPIRRVDPLTNVTTFGYDSLGNLVSTTNALHHISRIEYTAWGLPLILTDPRGIATTNEFDRQGNLVAVIDAMGFKTRFEHDAVGRKIRRVDALNRTNFFFYDNNDNLLYTVDALQGTNSFTYDANNNRIFHRDPRGVITASVFDLKDHLVATLAPLGFTISNRYDAIDRKVETQDARGNPTRFTYDDVGNLIAVTNALNEVTQFTHDPNGNQTSVVDPSGYYVTNFFDALNRKTVTIEPSISTNLTLYDALGRVIATTNANGGVTRFFHDAIGRLTNVADIAGNAVFFDYDANGNRIRTTDPNGHNWVNVFDELNRLLEQSDPQGHRTIFRYDTVGNLTNKLTPNGDSISYGHDALNRLTKITYPTGPPLSFAYDSVGNRTQMVDSLGTTTWVYDDLNRLVSVTDPYGQSVTNEFDIAGNRVALTYPGNLTVRYSYDPLNRMVALTNWLGGVITYGYDSRGNLVATTNADSTTAAYGYDVGSRLVALTNARADASVIAAYALTLDGMGNHLESSQAQPLYPLLPNQTNNYSYDSDNRLTVVDGKSVTHDSNGNLTGLGSERFGYDFENRLIQFTLSNFTGACAYDGMGNRLAATTNAVMRRLVLDRLGGLTQVLAETDTNGVAFARYVFGLGLSQRITPDGTVSTYHFDVRGSTVALSDSTGSVTDGYAYDSFGVPANQDGDSPQPFRYLGRHGIMDDSSGLYYARARHFSPQLGRFLTKDLLTGNDGDVQSLNRYIYALNNPLRLIDISGLSPREVVARAALGGSSDIPAHALLLTGHPFYLNNADPTAAIHAASVDWLLVGQGSVRLIKGVFALASGAIEASAGITIAAGGVASCFNTGIGCLGIPYGAGLAAPGIAISAGGFTLIVTGSTEILSGLLDQRSPLQDSIFEKYGEAIDEVFQ